jgi:UDP:flavonoid glycosyltransferase YjiC (YdhE family)
MTKRAIIMLTSNGVGAGHVIRACAIARELQPDVSPVILSMAYSVLDVTQALAVESEYVAGPAGKHPSLRRWNRYLRDRLVALIDETHAAVVTVDSVFLYEGIMAAILIRPDVRLVWIRRGMWRQDTPAKWLKHWSGFVDEILEPGDIAAEYDVGATSGCSKTRVFSPVSLYQPTRALSKPEARRLLGLPQDDPVVLVQMGVGSRDLDSRLTAVLRGLSKWPRLRVFMCRAPRDATGRSLVPDGMNVTVSRHFPLADVLHAFDAAVCAAGYNSVHEVIPAAIPTLLVANTRETDDQATRARWCADYGLSLSASGESLDELERQAAKLAQPELRSHLSANCARIGGLSGAKEMANVLRGFAEHPRAETTNRHWQRRMIMVHMTLRKMIVAGLRSTFAELRFVLKALLARRNGAGPKQVIDFTATKEGAVLRAGLKSGRPLEHVLGNASEEYLMRRRRIAAAAYMLP